MSYRLRASDNRFELKYLIPHDIVPAVTAALAEYTYPDPNSNGRHGYRVHSVYWDSPDLRFFWEKIEGEKYRRKLRFRRYGDLEEEVFVEIKQRTDRTLQKRRVRWPLERVRSTFNSSERLEWTANVQESPIVSEVVCLCHQYRLSPRMAISYRRQAFFAIYEPDLRITFDRRVQYSATELDLDRTFDVGKYVVDPRLVIMEIKFNERVPLWLCKVVSSFGFRIVRLSKYCTAVDREYYGSRLT